MEGSLLFRCLGNIMGHRLHYLSVALEMRSSLRTKHLCIHESVYLFLFYFFSRKSRQSWKIIKSLKDKQRKWSSWKDSQLRVYRFHKHHYYSIFCLPTWDYSELLGEIGLLVVLLGCLDQLLLTNACTHPWNVTFVLFFFLYTWQILFSLEDRIWVILLYLLRKWEIGYQKGCISFFLSVILYHFVY